MIHLTLMIGSVAKYEPFSREIDFVQRSLVEKDCVEVLVRHQAAVVGREAVVALALGLDERILGEAFQHLLFFSRPAPATFSFIFVFLQYSTKN